MASSLASPARSVARATRDCIAFLRTLSGLNDAELRPNLFMLQDDESVAHGTNVRWSALDITARGTRNESKLARAAAPQPSAMHDAKIFTRHGDDEQTE